VDPERFLNKIYPYTAWCFSPWTVAACLLLGLAAVSLILVQFDVFQSKLPAFHEFFGPKNWLWLGLTLAATKVLHEMGHALSCKHFGGECHEIGVMILVLTPCLYCNVSDSWMLPSKWKRAAIGAAGMYVEIVLASLATFIWWFSEPGMLNHLCLRVMFICSVSTVIFNGNPLLRFDGYYILSDLVEIPNLRQKSTSILNRMLAKGCLGMELPEEPFLPQRNQLFFALYTVAAVIYRWVVLISILIFLYKVFEPYGLQVIGQTIAAMSIGGMVVKPLWQLGKFLHTPGRLEQVKRPNLYATLGIVSAILAVILFLPLPHRITCSVEIRPRDAESVFVDVPGSRLEEVYVQPGQKVQAGERLARLSNLDVELALAQLTGQRNENELRLRYLLHERSRDEKAGQEYQEVKEMLEAVSEQLERKKADQARLELSAPIAGTVLPPPVRPPQKSELGRLPTWEGLLMDERNFGATINEAVLFCEIGDPQRLEAVLVIDQSDMPLVARDQQVEIKLDAFPGTTFDGRIEDIAKANLEVAPPSLSQQAGGDLPTKTDASGMPRPLSTSYRARVPLDDPGGMFRSGLRGRAKIDTGWQPLGSRFWRYLTHTFHFLL
jgi:putative peptide zinc metalloprotease protein